MEKLAKERKSTHIDWQQVRQTAQTENRVDNCEELSKGFKEKIAQSNIAWGKVKGKLQYELLNRSTTTILLP